MFGEFKFLSFLERSFSKQDVVSYALSPPQRKGRGVRDTVPIGEQFRLLVNGCRHGGLDSNRDVLYRNQAAIASLAGELLARCAASSPQK